MNKQISIPGFIVATPSASWETGDSNVKDGMRFSFWASKPSDGTPYITICEHTLAFEMPEGFDPRPQQVKALQEQERKLRAEFSKAVMEINAQIQSLQALEHTPAEPVTVDDDDLMPF